MPFFRKESLETLRQRVDLVEVVETFLELKRTGAAYKGLCPFHDEKTPSFTIQKGDRSYHCFGCGAHGDAIQFLMQQQSMSFSEAVEWLATRFSVTLEYAEETEEEKGPPRKAQLQALEEATLFFHTLLLHSEEGHTALQYLYQRGLTLEFIQQFKIGYAPKQTGILQKFLESKGISAEVMVAVALLRDTHGQLRDFFSERITIPIHNPQGQVIGFSARKFHEETFGGKYINTSETSLFKKSKVLFGLNYCRRTIAKERRAIIVEGQLDCLRLIFSGLTIAVAGQGTAFGEGHVHELTHLGVRTVFLALDSDTAGIEAATKIGNLFQKVGVEVRVVPLPAGEDPDSFVRTKGVDAFKALLETAGDYLSFIVSTLSKKINLKTAAGKNELVEQLSAQIRTWESPVMVHETLRALAKIVQLPESLVLGGTAPSFYIKNVAAAGAETIHPHTILESDFLRWVILQPEYLPLARANILVEDILSPPCQELYRGILEDDLLGIAGTLSPEALLILNDIHKKRINKEKAKEQLLTTMKKILERNWFLQREEIRSKMQSGISEEEVMELLKLFNGIKMREIINVQTSDLL